MEGRANAMVNDATYLVVAVSARDAQALETLKRNADELARTFCIPAHMLGVTQ